MSNSNRTLLQYTRETAWRTPVLPAASAQGTIGLFDMRFNSETLDHVKATVKSEEINDDRMTKELIQVGIDTTGSTTHEWTAQDFDDLINAVMMNDYQLILSTSCTVSGQTITADAGTPFGPLLGAKFIKLANCATSGNNGIKKVISITTSVITLAAGSLSGSDTGDTIDFYLNEYSVMDSVTVTVTGTGTILTASVGTFSATTQAARYVRVDAGTGSAIAAGNRGIRKVVSCTSTVLTLAAATSGADESTKTAVIVARYTRPGTTLISHIFQKSFLDLATPHYLAFTGQCANEMNINMAARAKAMIDFSFMGYEGVSRTATLNTEAYTAASNNSVINTTGNVGSVLVDGSATVNPVKTANLKVNNNLRTRVAVGLAGTLELGTGESSISGQMDVYFTDKTLLEKFINHVTASLEYNVTDASGNVVNLYMPKIQYSKGTPTIPRINDDVMQTLPYDALKDETKGYHLQIDRLSVS